MPSMRGDGARKKKNSFSRGPFVVTPSPYIGLCEWARALSMETRQAVMANDSSGFLLMLISHVVDLFLSCRSRVWPLFLSVCLCLCVCVCLSPACSRHHCVVYRSCRPVHFYFLFFIFLFFYFFCRLHRVERKDEDGSLGLFGGTYSGVRITVTITVIIHGRCDSRIQR